MPDRGRGACARVSSLCRGRGRSRVCGGGGRLCIWIWGVSRLIELEETICCAYEKRKKTRNTPRMIRLRTSQRTQLLQDERLL